MKKIFFVFASMLLSLNMWADPVSWNFKLVDKDNGEVELLCEATIQQGWHLYDTEIPQGGPVATNITIDEVKGATAVGTFKAIGSKLHKEYDNIFEMEIGYYETKATFAQRFKVTDKKAFTVKGDVRAQACNDKECTPPLPNDFSFTAKDLPAGFVGASTEKPKDNEPKAPETDKIVISAATADTVLAQTISVAKYNEDSDLWAPVIDELKSHGAAGDLSKESLFGTFFWGFIGGLIALLTPCVWPIIPMTVSFFLKRNKKSKAKAIKDAVTYGLAIILIYLTLGLLITFLFGASALNELSTNMIFNLFLFGLLIVFAASFLGAFEIVLPSSWTNKMDSKADSTTGFVSIFFMAFTLALVSFSCTGPIIGTLLVETATSGAILGPAVGMFGFALALAIPFTLFAIFPSWLNSMPKSGGWLNSVKVVLGFLELALAFKFLSVADMTNKWGILDREVFLVLWIVIFALLGMYLLGKLRFAHDSESSHISVFRLFMAIVSLSFAVYMVPGLWGAPLRAISAFAPLPNTQDFNLYEGGVHAKFDDYDAGMEYARKNNKPVIVDFSGYGCVNCRDMETSVWIDSRVKHILENDYVLITLMVDDKEKLPQTIEIEENGKTTKLKTIGDKWSYLQRRKFGTNSQPYYVTLDLDGKPIGPSYAYDKDIEKYLLFLNTGLENFKK
ncbi:thiol:disulfide interchange protein [Dysgonomonas sp. 216]|uniref:protein-disulfide reductase DsbD family protein n=1 Tax=Dysgonomonas sp. 216 TaxID=2302934 RepID=UPI0013D6B6BD|nr:cytochrome c biogenesis protein CcdA [Dysgonomonas sp. 216]NDW17306.1 thiol:disulfide interchange protein [Dysgonomonas sp. 216]